MMHEDLTPEELQTLQDQSKPKSDRIAVLEALLDQITQQHLAIPYEEFYPVDAKGNRIEATTDDEIRAQAKNIALEHKNIDAAAIQSLINNYDNYKNYKIIDTEGQNKILPHQKRTFDSISDAITLYAVRELRALAKAEPAEVESAPSKPVKPESGKLKELKLSENMRKAISDYDISNKDNPLTFEYLKTFVKYDKDFSRPFDKITLPEKKDGEAESIAKKREVEGKGLAVKKESFKTLKDNLRGLPKEDWKVNKSAIKYIKNTFEELQGFKDINQEFKEFKEWAKKNPDKEISEDEIEALRKYTLSGFVFNVMNQDRPKTTEESVRSQFLKNIATHFFSDTYETITHTLKTSVDKPWNQVNYINERFTHLSTKASCGDAFNVVKELYDRVLLHRDYQAFDDPSVQKEIRDNYIAKLETARNDMPQGQSREHINVAINYYRKLDQLDKATLTQTVTVVDKLSSLIAHYQEKNKDGKNKAYTTMVTGLNTLLTNVLMNPEFAKSDEFKKGLDKIRQQAPFYGLFSKHLKEHIKDIHASLKQHH